MASTLPTLRRAAPRFAKLSFQCSHSRSFPRGATQPDPFKETSFRHRKAFRTSTRKASSAATGTLSPEAGSSSSPLLDLGKSIAQDVGKTKRGFFPSTSEKSVAYWLLGSAASVFGIVVFGGLTRLTESGYCALFCNVWLGTDHYSKPKYHRVEACYGQPAANKRRGLGVRIQ